ncbi:MAG: CPBP family intramembrane metalloprotease [Bacteroidetes bacterium]|nr:CPBP family intramembrane metalloprotease [Bacteroidota bacterium]MCW5895143.1 CPBP family intramembrane metalloprotease [Bacteroidota bacterium]
MKRILSYLQEYFDEQWNIRLFASTGIFLALCFAVNYGFDAEVAALRKLAHPLHQFIFYFFFYSIPYGVTVCLYAIFTHERRFFRERNFYLLAVFGFALLALYVTLHNVPAYTVRQSPSLFGEIALPYLWYFARYASNLLPGLGIIIPLALYWHVHDRSRSRFYGFSSSNINLKTYFAILLFLVPVVLAASFGADFQSAYPRFKFGLPASAAGIEKALLIGFFEVCYGVDFVFVELIFRGFLVMAFARYLGSGAILPMVVVYAFIHFQKPMGEAIGSIVGGMVLGVISYRTNSIYGGVILHLGVAYLMEVAGTLQMFVR